MYTKFLQPLYPRICVQFSLLAALAGHLWSHLLVHLHRESIKTSHYILARNFVEY